MDALNFHYDDGHGWLKVPLSTLAQFGLQCADFSSYSYRNKDCIYLEEDCDATKFLAIAGPTGAGRIIEISDGASSFIRRMARNVTA
jgi:hypothetical protein